MSLRERREKKYSSDIQIHCLEDESLQKQLKVFGELLASCRGPHGKVKVIQNAPDGHVTWTKLSSRLLSVMSESTPVLKLISSSIQGHLDRFKDGGLLVGQLCIALILSSIHLTVRKKLVTELYECFTNVIDVYISSDECDCKYEVDIFKLDHVRRVLKSILGHKLFHLRSDNQEKVFILFLNAFLHTIPLKHEDFISDRVYIQCLSRGDISESECFNGLLLECPDWSSSFEQILKNMTPDSHDHPEFRVVLVTESMAGDTEALGDVTYEVESGFDMTTVVVEHLKSLCAKMLDLKVNLLLCQRVIHPNLKTFLTEAGIMFIDRLGSSPVPYVRDLTGAIPLSGIVTECDKNWHGFGFIDRIKHQTYTDRNYLLLTKEEKPIVTLVFKSYLEEVVDDVKNLCQSSLHTLRMMTRDPHVLAGGGCWMTHVAAYLSKKVMEDKSKLLEEYGCTETQLQTVLANFTQCLLSSANKIVEGKFHVVDSKHYHIWSTDIPLNDSCTDQPIACSEGKPLTCNCGMLDSSSELDFEYVVSDTKLAQRGINLTQLTIGEKHCPTYVDSTVVVKNALKMAVATAITVLSITQFIHDQN